jgi:hypothetical protein
MIMPDDFAVFILSHGRHDNVRTFKTLRDNGYTGKIFIVIDDEDKTADMYKKKFKGIVEVFSKKEVAKKTDVMDNFGKMGVVLYARNACFDIAEKLGIKWFLELDDDYVSINWSYDKGGNYVQKTPKIKNLDRAFLSMLEYYKAINATSIAFAQGGDFIGGKYSKKVATGPKVSRKAMNSFFMSTERLFRFMGSINEDVNTYVSQGARGSLFMTINIVSLRQIQTQKNAGGMTGLYLDSGTYVKSFYSVIASPSCVKVRLMGAKHQRLHHSISWENAVPKIVPESWCKEKKTGDI